MMFLWTCNAALLNSAEALMSTDASGDGEVERAGRSNRRFQPALGHFGKAGHRRRSGPFLGVYGNR